MAYAVAGLSLAAISLVFTAMNGIGWAQLVGDYTLTNLVIGVSLLLPGVAIRWFQRRNRIGTLMIVSGLGALGTAAAAMMLRFALSHAWPAMSLRVLATVYIGSWQLGLGFCFDIAMLLFPTQRLLSVRWWPILWLMIASGSYQLLTGILSSGQIYGDPRAVSIISVGRNLEDNPFNASFGFLNLFVTLAAVVGMVLRYRRGDEKVKRQILWLLLALIAFIVVNVQRFFTGTGPILLLLSILFIPLAIGIAIVRYELFDIRLVVSRTLAYTATVAVIVGAYAGLVAVLSLVISQQMRRGIPVSAALVVAFAFNPVRLYAQRLTDRGFYGSRSDPAAIARHVSAYMHTDELTYVLARARDALKLPWMALERLPDGQRLAEAGARSSGPSTDVGLTYQGNPVGTLQVELRKGERSLHDSDRATLDLICTPLAIALHAMALSRQVTQARTATVEAAATERVRLQRELHDGLGPTLTSIAFRVDAVTNTLRTDTDAAEGLMSDVGADLRAVIEDVRRIVYGLRPIELDDLGLLDAVRQQAAAIPVQGGRTVAVEITSTKDLPQLSPAVELAAYRIIMESVTNVLRHSTAQACAVTLTAGDHLDVTIADSGTPPPGWRPGVGIRSMRDRAEELGGTASAGPGEAGWIVRARLPLAS